MPITRIICVPGLLELPALLIPLMYRLRQRCDHVDYFADRIVFRDLQTSVDRLAETIGRNAETQTEPEADSSIALVTHSFGDWVARQAIARTPNHRVTALVSLTPALRPTGLLQAFHWATAGLIPEMQIIMNRERAAQALELDPVIRRIVFWAKVDALVTPVDVPADYRIHVQRIAATHLTIVMQPNVAHAIENFLFRD